MYSMRILVHQILKLIKYNGTIHVFLLLPHMSLFSHSVAQYHITGNDWVKKDFMQ